MSFSEFSPDSRPILSVYSGFFSGGARNVHTDIVGQMHDFGVPQVVVNLRDQVDRGLEGVQDKSTDANYRKLISKGIDVRSAGLDAQEEILSYKSIKAMVAFLQETNPRVVLCLKEQTAELVIKANRFLERANLPTYPIIITLHRTDPGVEDPDALERLQSLEKFSQTKKFILGYLACAESSAIAYQEALDLAHEPNRFKYVHNGIDLDVFQPASEEQKDEFFKQYLPQAHEQMKDAPIIMIGARNSKEKNISLFLESAVSFLSKNKNAHAVLCGTGLTTDNLADVIHDATRQFEEGAKVSIQNRIHPIGPIPREDMAILASAAKVISLTSQSEADPLVLKEGMSCGAVPVSTCVGDAPNVLGVNNPQDYYLRDIDVNFVLGKRGIITSQNAPDIARAWAYAVRNEHSFTTNIVEYRETIEKARMVGQFLEAVEEFCSMVEPRAAPQAVEELHW